MSYQVLIGERKALVFPVMGYGYLRIDYSDEIASQSHGFFNHDESITIQAIVTPYDVNGFGYEYDLDNPIGYHGVASSKKTLPAEQGKDYIYKTFAGASDTIATTETQRHHYLSQADALTYEMMIFYNTNVQLSLINSTTTNQNQPSEYKIKLTINANGTSDSLTTSNAVITANDVVGDQLSTTYGYDNTGAGARYSLLGGCVYSSGDTFTTTLTEDESFQTGMRLYTQTNQTFTHVATVLSATSTTVTVASGHSLVNGTILFTDVNKEANYLVSPHHISVSYNNTTGHMSIYLNGSNVASKFHSAGSSLFNIDGSDTVIGAIGNIANTITRKQFMGELHELAVLKGAVTNFVSTDTLIPNYRNTLLYYRFEEVDL